MNGREYDIFEKLPDGDDVWRGAGTAPDNLRFKLDQLAQDSPNAFFAVPARASRKRVRNDERVNNQSSMAELDDKRADHA